MKEGYLDFEEYIRQGEPDKKEKASVWRTAIGLQAVDGLKTSDYLKDTARKHIEGEMRDYDITKKEWVLNYDMVHYLNWEDLRNRYLHIHPTAEWSVQPNLADHTNTPQLPEQVPEQVADTRNQQTSEEYL